MTNPAKRGWKPTHFYNFIYVIKRKIVIAGWFGELLADDEMTNTFLPAEFELYTMLIKDENLDMELF